MAKEADLSGLGTRERDLGMRIFLIRTIMEERDISQEDVAAELGISYQAVSSALLGNVGETWVLEDGTEVGPKSGRARLQSRVNHWYWPVLENIEDAITAITDDRGGLSEVLVKATGSGKMVALLLAKRAALEGLMQSAPGDTENKTLRGWSPPLKG